jgi:hypothetical protein
VNAVIFLGPSLPLAEARAILDATYLPPVAQGDVYRAALKRPAIIGIIDGFFERVPSVWHKEILWAMNQGIHVLGAASMGALRAAELASFGMEPIGQIARDFISGNLQDDDEVAVAHATADEGYIPRSTAMVDIRATLSKAVKDNIISIAVFETLLSLAKALYYPERIYPLFLKRALDSGTNLEDINRLKQWLPAGQVSQKRADALELLYAVKAAGENVSPKQVSYVFHQTALWQSVVESIREDISTRDQ